MNNPTIPPAPGRYTYTTSGTCSRTINFEIDSEGILRSVEFVGGCPGNTMGVSKLCVGRPVTEVIELLRGIDCKGRGTSCPDQLARALSSHNTLTPL